MEMIMLISDALKTWCPKYQSDRRGDNRWHTEGLFNRQSNCIANKCGVWNDTGYDGWEKERTGHCGLIKM